MVRIQEGQQDFGVIHGHPDQAHLHIHVSHGALRIGRPKKGGPRVDAHVVLGDIR